MLVYVWNSPAFVDCLISSRVLYLLGLPWNTSSLSSILLWRLSKNADLLLTNPEPLLETENVLKIFLDYFIKKTFFLYPCSKTFSGVLDLGLRYPESFLALKMFEDSPPCLPLRLVEFLSDTLFLTVTSLCGKNAKHKLQISRLPFERKILLLSLHFPEAGQRCLFQVFHHSMTWHIDTCL